MPQWVQGFFAVHFHGNTLQFTLYRFFGPLPGRHNSPASGLRYLDGLRWEDIAEQLYGDDPRFWDQQDTFLRRSFKLHSQALEELTNYVPLQAGREKENMA